MKKTLIFKCPNCNRAVYACKFEHIAVLAGLNDIQILLDKGFEPEFINSQDLEFGCKCNKQNKTK